MTDNTDTPNLADDERGEADFQRREEAAGREQLDVSATQQTEEEKTITKDLDALRKLVGQQFYTLLKRGEGRKELVKAARNVLHEEQGKLSVEDVKALANEALRHHATERQEEEKARIREKIDAEKPEAAGILETFQKMKPEQKETILKRGKWTRTLKDGTTQTLTVQEQEGKLFFIDATGQQTEITTDMKFRFTERFQKGTIPEGIAAGREFPFNHKGKWYLAKTDGKLNEEGKLVLFLKDTDGKEWRTTCPPERLSVYRETSVDANGVLNKSGKPDRYAMKYTPQQRKEASATKGIPAGTPAAQPEKPAASPDAIQPPAPPAEAAPAESEDTSGNTGKPAEDEGAAPAAPAEDPKKELKEGMEKVLAITNKEKQAEVLEKLINQEVEKRLKTSTSEAVPSPAPATAAQETQETAAPTTPPLPLHKRVLQKVTGWFRKVKGWLGKWRKRKGGAPEEEGGEEEEAPVAPSEGTAPAAPPSVPKKPKGAPAEGSEEPIYAWFDLDIKGQRTLEAMKELHMKRVACKAKDGNTYFGTLVKPIEAKAGKDRRKYVLFVADRMEIKGQSIETDKTLWVPLAEAPAKPEAKPAAPVALEKNGPTGQEVSNILRTYNDAQLKTLKDLVQGELTGKHAPQGILIEKDYPALYTSGGYKKFRISLPRAIDVLLADRQFSWLQRMTKENATALRNIIDKSLKNQGGFFVNTLTQVVADKRIRENIVDLVKKGQWQSLLAALNRKIGKPER